MVNDAENEISNLVQRDGWFYCDFREPSGRRIRKALKTQNIKIAKQRLMKMQTESYEKGYFELKRPVKMLFSELAVKVLDYIKDRKRCFKKVYVPMMKPMVEKFGQKYLHEIKTGMVEQYQREKKEEISISYANRAVRVLKRAFNLAIQWGFTNSNPVRGIEFYKQPRGRIRYLSIEESNRLLDCCSGYLKEIVLIALHTGMRKGEILGLKWGNVELGSRLIILDKTKNDEVREIPMSNAVYEVLLAKYKEQVRDKDEYIFANRDGKARWDITQPFHRAMESAGIRDFVFHDLRHTFASQLVMSGVDLLTVKVLMGHHDVKTTLIYAHLAPKHKIQAIQQLEGYLEGNFGHNLDTNGVFENVTKNVLEKSL